MQETEEKTTDVFYRFRKRDILKENGLRRNGKGRIRMKRAYFNCILLDGTEQMEPVAHNNVGTGGLPRPCTSPLPSGTKRWMPCLTRIWHKCYNILKFRPCQSGR